MKENKDINEATIVVKEMSKSEQMRRLAFLRQKAIMDEKSIKRAGIKEGMKEGMKEGIKKGMIEGAKKSKIKIAQKMLENGFKIEMIADMTELKNEEIEKIKNKSTS